MEENHFQKLHFLFCLPEQLVLSVFFLLVDFCEESRGSFFIDFKLSKTLNFFLKNFSEEGMPGVTDDDLASCCY